MSSIIIPENILYNALESVIKYIRKDLEKNIDNDKNSILYRLLGENIDGKPLSMNRWNFFKQSKKIFLDKNNLSVNFGYNPEVAKLISLHIILPSEQADSSAIGQDEGYGAEDEEDLNFYFTQNFTSNYQIMITSNNSSEVMTVYHVLKSLLLMIVPHLEIMGLRLNKFSGNDIIFRDEMMPNGIFHKVLNISCNYELKVPQLLTNEIIKGIVINGHLLENIEDDCNEENYIESEDIIGLLYLKTNNLTPEEKVDLMKECKKILGISLADSKKLIDNAPSILLECSLIEANNLKINFDKYGNYLKFVPKK